MTSYRNSIIIGDSREVLWEMALSGEKVNLCVTSPPYFSLRSNLPQDHPAKAQEIGSEPSVGQYIENLVEILGCVRDVLTDDGLLFLNLGDSMSGSGGAGGDYGPGGMKEGQPKYSGTREKTADPPKNLIGIPFLVAARLKAEGWYWRSLMPWIRRNGLPVSAPDRPSACIEYVLMFSKSPKYYFNMDAVRRANAASTVERGKYHWAKQDTKAAQYQEMNGLNRNEKFPVNPKGRAWRNSDSFFDSWQGLYEEDNEPLAFVVNPAKYKGAHFSTFPVKLVEPMVMAGSRIGDLVLDPFGGSGTVGLVAKQKGREYCLIDLVGDYEQLMKERIESGK